MSDASWHGMMLQIPDALGSSRYEELSRQHGASAIRTIMGPFDKQFEKAVAAVGRRRLAPYFRNRSDTNSTYAIRSYLAEERDGRN